MTARAKVGTGAGPSVRKLLQARKIGPRPSPEKISGPECEPANEEAMLARCEVQGRSRGEPLALESDGESEPGHRALDRHAQAGAVGTHQPMFGDDRRRLFRHQ